MSKKMSPYEWAYKHTENLRNIKGELLNSSTNKIIQENYIKIKYRPGYWTILKNISLAYCLEPFGKILKNNNIINTIYIDLFSGCGITPLRSDKQQQVDNSKWIPGSPIISTKMTNYPFSKYYFGDNDRFSNYLLKKIFKTTEDDGNLNINYEILSPKDANENFIKLLPKIRKQYVFVYIDPTGFQWDWKSMEELFKLKMFDIFLNFQTREVDRISGSKLKTFFGPCENQILYKCNNCNEKLKVYISQIENNGCFVTPIRIGKDETNKYYYHLLHISKKDTYKAIITGLKKKVEAFDGVTIERIWKDLSGASRQLSFDVD